MPNPSYVISLHKCDFCISLDAMATTARRHITHFYAIHKVFPTKINTIILLTTRNLIYYNATIFIYTQPLQNRKKSTATLPFQPIL